MIAFIVETTRLGSWKVVYMTYSMPIITAEEIQFMVGYDMFRDQILSLISRYKREKWIGWGRHRAVFRRGNIVVKVPLSEYGVADNEREARYYRMEQEYYNIKYCKENHLARCFMFNQICLVMEYVKPAPELWGIESWTSAVDCGQIGHNKIGKLVAYDYGY